MEPTESTKVTMAKEILRGKSVPSAEMYQLADSLRTMDQFGYARQLFGRLRKSPVIETELRFLLGESAVRVRLAQKHALCTYKDPDIPADVRLTRALEILGEVEDLKLTADQETLGLAGAIYKRKWQLDGQKQHLERSLAYYRHGHAGGAEKDFGYNGINAAYVLDLLAHIETAEAAVTGTESRIAQERREDAEKIRRELVEALPALADAQSWLDAQWWFLVTVAEAYFGLGDYENAGVWLTKAKALVEGGRVSDWEYEATARQLGDLARLQGDQSCAPCDFKDLPGWNVLEEFMTISGKKYSAGVRSAFVGKVGLALSGGGFRASLFHIGVLAKLAELDVLRSVEVLSCVSGGSIIGAHYYLEVRHLLQTKKDEEITREDYIRIVQTIERDFLEGVQRNIRTRVAAEVTTNFKTVFKKNYTRTERIGELFEEFIFSRVNDGEGERPRWMSDLYINPKDETESFTPKKDNWRRAAKVPILILNATSLNTGHNWQFTASWMGEPAASINSEIDANAQLRRMYYEEAPDGYRKFRLGRAVAASACVPGLFDPVALDDLFPGMTVRLVDGGVHDNQGVAGLLEQGSNVLLVSDASGQMETEPKPSAGVLAVPQRSLDMLMARVREAQYDDLKARRNTSLLRGLMFLHLKKDLDVDPVDWIGCEDPYNASDESRPVERRGPLTTYGVRKDVQQRLAAIRTDLDAFSDTEAYALMTSGYLMTEHEFKSCIQGFPEQKEERSKWRFLALEDPMKKTGGEAMMRLLEVAHSRALKVWKYSKLTMLPVFLGTALLVGAAVYAMLRWVFGPSPLTSLTWGDAIGVLFAMVIGGAIVLYLAVLIIGPILLVLLTILKIRDHGKTFSQIFTGILFALFGWFPARIQLHVLDKWYLALGDIKVRATAPDLKTEANAGARDIKVLGVNIDRANTSESLNKVVDQSNIVEAVGRLFEAKNYVVKRFPRDYDINPLQINLDLYAESESQRVLAIIKTPADSKTTADWQTASSLETAAWFLSNQQDRPPQKGTAPQRSRGVAALLILMDVEPHETLKPFVERGAVKVFPMTRDDVCNILAKGAVYEEGTNGERSLNRELVAESARLLGGLEEFRSVLAMSVASTGQTEV